MALSAGPDLVMPAAPESRIRVDIGTLTAPAASDYHKECATFTTDTALGGTLYQTGFEVHIVPTLHHIALYPMPTSLCGQNGPIDLNLLAAAQNGNAVMHLPDGVALRYNNIHGIAGSIHLINATTKDISISGYVDVLYVTRDQVKTVAAELMGQAEDIYVAPGETKTVFGTCRTPVDMQIAVLMYHVHNHLDHGGISVENGKTVLSTTQWDQGTLLRLDPPLSLPAGGGLTYTCTYRNDSGTPITWGTSATQDMCGFMAWYYPDAGDLNCTNHSDTQVATILNR